MCLESPDAPEPDPSIGVAQQKLADLAVRQQDYYEQNIAPRNLEQMDQALAIAKTQSEKQSELQDYQMGLSKKYDDRYWGTQVPLEDQIIDAAKAYNEPVEQERMAGQAGADVSQASAAGQASLQRGLRMRGIDSGSAASVSAMAEMQSNADLAKAGAVNKTREAARQLGWTRLGEAAALGRGLPSFGTTSASLASGAGQATLQAGTSGVGSVATASNTSAQGGGAAATWNSVGNLGLGAYNANLDAYNTAANIYGAEIGALAKVAGGSAAAASGGASSASDRRLKTDIKRVGMLDNGLPVYVYRYKDGGPFVMGVMADEVETVLPGAVTTRPDGYKAVFYNMIPGA